MAIITGDIRDYVIPLFVAEDSAADTTKPVVVSRDRFLGTAFFISKNGIAMTAAHCVPKPDQIPSGMAFLALVWTGDRPAAQQVVMASVQDDQDIAVLKIKFSPSKYLPVSFEQTYMGEDVVSIGVPLHSVNGPQYEFRCLKGHITLQHRYMELSYPAAKGMSGSPVLRDGHVVGVLSNNARGESLEDQTEETTEKIGNITRITKTVTMAVTNYGRAEPLSGLAAKAMPFTEGEAFAPFLARVNAA